MTGLETVYVPAEAYDDYSAAYKSYLPSGARLQSSGTEGDFQIDDGVLTVYLGQGGEVVIPEGVTAIGTSAFQNCTTLTKVTIPGSVTSIGSYAFKGCTGLEEVVFPEGLTNIESCAFSGCTALSSVALPESLTGIGASAFSGCTGLTELSLPTALTTIGASAFSGCTGLTELSLPTALTTIGNYAFSECTGLTGGLTIPGSVTSIGQYAFQDCTGLDGKLVIEGGAKTIGIYAFYNCGKLSGVELGNGVTGIGNSAFQNCTGMTGDLVIPDSVTSIGASAFDNCSGFKGTLTLSANLSSLGTYAFRNCSGFSGELVIPDTLTGIPQAAFSGMSGISSLVFGENVSSIYTYFSSSSSLAYYHALYGMTGVKEVTFTGLTVPKLTNSVSPFYYMTGLETIFVPAQAYDAYVSAYSSYAGSSVVFSSDFLQAKPTNFKAEKLYSQSAVLSWNPHTSERVVGYTVFRDGEVIGTTTECSFTDRELVTGRAYSYSVQGYTEEGDTTSATELTVTPAGPNILDIKTGNSLNKINDSSRTISIYVSNSKNLQPLGDERTTGKLYYVNQNDQILIGEAELSATLGSASTGVYTIDWDISVFEDGEYELLFVLTDVDGESDEYSETVTIDRSVPEQIVGVTAIGDVQVIYLTWAISTEADTTIYRIYRRAESDEAFRLIAQINNRNTLNYTDSNVKTDRIYYYYVVGVNGFGQEGEASEIAGATLSSDTEAPTVTKLTPVNASFLSKTVKFTLTAEDNVSVTSAALYYSVDNSETWNLLAELSAGNFSATLDTTKLPDGIIHVKGVAYDAAGNESSPLTYVYSVDNTGPEQVQGLAYESTNVTVTLSWNDVADEDIRYYRVEQRDSDGSYHTVSDVYSTLGVNIYNLTPETRYTYRVVGYDTQGNRGTPSDDITAVTLGDTTAPVVTKIQPTSGYYSTGINLSITATDEYNVARILVQTSADAMNWDDIYTETYTGISKSRTLSYVLSLENYPEGLLYVRAIATDTSGNESDSGVNAPYVQHMVDRTAPAAPDSVKATGNSGYIEVSWVQGSETDLHQYAVYRAEAEDGAYSLLKDSIAATNYIDRNVKEGVVYYYKVAVDDVAGNVSEYSAVVSAEVIRDTDPPEIYSVYPESGSKLGLGFKTISVLAIDNNCLAKVLVEYSHDGENYSTLLEKTGINAYNITLSADIPVAEFADGDTVYVRFSAEDASGNTCGDDVRTYSIDAVAPSVKAAQAEFTGKDVYISWTGYEEEDLSVYRIYRKTGLTGSYSLFAQRQAVNGQEEYYCYDSNLADEAITYYYKIEAVDRCGNASSIATNAVTLPDRSLPTPVISCETTQEIGVEYFIDASLSKDNTGIVSYLFDFGDGTTSTAVKPVHVYGDTGEYTIS